MFTMSETIQVHSVLGLVHELFELCSVSEVPRCDQVIAAQMLGQLLAASQSVRLPIAQRKLKIKRAIDKTY
jgi:hypothetical protein